MVECLRSLPAHTCTRARSASLPTATTSRTRGPVHRGLLSLYEHSKHRFAQSGRIPVSKKTSSRQLTNRGNPPSSARHEPFGGSPCSPAYAVSTPGTPGKMSCCLFHRGTGGKSELRGHQARSYGLYHRVPAFSSPFVEETAAGNFEQVAPGPVSVDYELRRLVCPEDILRLIASNPP